MHGGQGALCNVRPEYAAYLICALAEMLSMDFHADGLQAVDVAHSVVTDNLKGPAAAAENFRSAAPFLEA